MRLNERNYAPYIALQKGDAKQMEAAGPLIDFIGIQNVEAMLSTMQDVFNGLKYRYYISDTFFDSMQKAKVKLKEAMDSMDNISDEMGRPTMIMYKTGFCIYDVQFNKDMKRHMRLFVFDKDCWIGYKIFNIETPSKDDIVNNGFMMSSKLDPRQAINVFMSELIYTSFFINNCELETVVLKPKERARIGNVRYYNEENKSDITILDCTWFRELIVDGAFKVNGHLRWQPCGENRAKRKLIWIESFEKKGYHRKAKMEQQDYL